MLFPIRRQTWAPAVIGHTTGSILFAFGHHALMVAMRIPWYAVNGREYVWHCPPTPEQICFPVTASFCRLFRRAGLIDARDPGQSGARTLRAWFTRSFSCTVGPLSKASKLSLSFLA
jgi:hypothetical protein